MEEVLEGKELVEFQSKPEIPKATLKLDAWQIAFIKRMLQETEDIDLKLLEVEDFEESLDEQLEKQNFNFQMDKKNLTYSDFKNFDELEERFEIKIIEKSIDWQFESKEASKRLQEDLKDAKKLAPITEKELSELIIAPIMKEIWRNSGEECYFYSGHRLNADDKKGLKGECDFMLTFDTSRRRIKNPIFSLVEAKRNDLSKGIVQCIAQMLGAAQHNKAKNETLPIIYGCATVAHNWVFIYYDIQENTVYVDNEIYQLAEIDKILGIFEVMLEKSRKKT